MTSTVIYTGELRTQMTHLQSGTVVETDAPVDNNGKGERFSPTDIVATALASCMLTIIGIAARTHGFSIDGTSCDVEKIMAANPRRIGAVHIKMRFPEDQSYDEKTRAIIEKAALTCPVIESLHPDCKKEVSFIWP
ncbi:OsmC family protein [Rurimicrobium arvi]